MGKNFDWFQNRAKKFVTFFLRTVNLFTTKICLNSYKVLISNAKLTVVGLFIDTSRRNFKAAFLFIESKDAYVLVGHSLHLKKCYENLDSILTKLSYVNHEWKIFGRLKVIPVANSVRIG